MRRFDVRWVPLAVALGAFVGSALVSSVAVADEPSPIDEAVLVVEPSAAEPTVVDPILADESVGDQGQVESSDLDQPDVEAVAVEVPSDPPEAVVVT